jgi:Flp pilus assembly protein TadD
MLLGDAGRLDEAIADLQKILQTDPKDTATLLQLGTLETARKPAKAVEIFSSVLTLLPDEWQAFRGRGDAYLNLGRQAEAVADYEKALRREPNDPGTLNNLAWVLATSPDAKLRDGRRAVRLATAAGEATGYKRAYILSTLAAACAETGDFPSAQKWSAKAIETGDREQTAALKRELESYKAHRPWRELLSEGKPQAMKPAAAQQPKTEKTPGRP